MRRASGGAALAVWMLLAGACGSRGREAERAVRAYNEAAIQAYRARDFGPLREVASEAEWGRVVVLVDLKSANRLALESDLLALDVTGMDDRGPDQTTVRTTERWRYWDRPLEPGRPRGTVFVAEMDLEYALTRSGRAWKVDRVRPLAPTRYLEPKGWEAGEGQR